MDYASGYTTPTYYTTLLPCYGLFGFTDIVGYLDDVKGNIIIQEPEATSGLKPRPMALTMFLAFHGDRGSSSSSWGMSVTAPVFAVNFKVCLR